MNFGLVSYELKSAIGNTVTTGIKQNYTFWKILLCAFIGHENMMKWEHSENLLIQITIMCV